jgi:uncharacterized protein (TIGR03437 family)
MLRKSWFVAAVSVFLLAGSAWAGTFGKVVSIGGEASDLALDEPRGLLYVANFTANRIDVMSLASNTVVNSINVAPQPSSISLSPNGRWLVTTHFGNNLAPASPTNALTLIDLSGNNTIQTFALGNPPLGAAFGIDNKALVVTTHEYLLFDPVSGGSTVLDTIAGVTAKTLPVPAATFPADITTASVTVSRDRRSIFGLGSSTGTVTFRYDVVSQQISPGAINLSSGTLGPRVVSLNSDGSLAMAGWVIADSAGTFINFFPQRSNEFSVGTTAFDDSRGLLYAQIPAVAGESPTLQILDSDNLTLRQRLKLPENTKGRSVLTQDASILYAVSDSGVLVLPVGSLSKSPRVVASAKDLVFRGNFCDPRVATQTLTISDPGNGNTPFTISSSSPGVTVSPASGVTPATVTVSVDPNIYQAQKGTVAVTLTLASSTAVNVPPQVRVLINSREPDQRGTFLDIPGTLVDLMADPLRNRYYVLRQDTNEVLVYNSLNNTQVGSALRTYNMPSSLAITQDNKYLLVGHLASQTLAVFDLDTFEVKPYIQTEAGAGNVVRSMAVTTRGILATSEDFKGTGHIIRIDLGTRTATQLPTLGVFQNTIPVDSVIASSSNGSKALVAAADGTVYVYDANVDSFTVSRKDFTALSGAYAASSLDQFVVGGTLLDSSGVPVAQFESATGGSSGFVFTGPVGIRTTAPNSFSPGIIQRVSLTDGSSIRPTRMVEAPLLGAATSSSVFTRSLAILPDWSMVLSMTTSGITVLPFTYDAAVAIPTITSVVSAADMKSPAAPGGLMSVLGTNLSGTNQATSEMPLPTIINDSCLTVNGQPVHMMFVSSGQVNAQMPAQASGNVSIIMHTPGGVSNTFLLSVPTGSPAVFLTTVGDQTNLPTIVRFFNGLVVTATNPVHRGDYLVIYLTGLGAVNPPVPDGVAAPANPLSSTVITPTVQIGGMNAPVLFSGLVPGYVGLYVLNVSVPSSTPQGLSVPLTIAQGGVVSYSQNVRVVQQQ